MATLSSSSMLLHCLLSSMVFDEKLAVNLTEDPYMWYITFTFFQNPLSLFLLVVDFAVARCGFFFSQFILLEVFWAPGMCRLIFYIKFGKFGATISSNRLPALFFFPLLSFWNSCCTYVGMLDGVTQVFEALLIFLYSVFFLCSDLVMSIDLFMFFSFFCWC